MDCIPDKLRNINTTGYLELKKKVVNYICENLKESRLQHTFRVANLAKEMAAEKGVSVYKAEIAALLHDCARNISEEELAGFAVKLALPDSCKTNINLAHSKIGAYLAESLFDITDKDILNSITYHTTGRAAMSELEMIIFLADAIEQGRSYPGVEYIREEAEKSLERGCAASLKGTIDHIENKGQFLDKNTVLAYEYIKEKI